MSQAPVIHERREGFALITLNRPDRLNSFNVAQHKALAAALDACEADDTCRAILLTGAGRGFCAGQDLSERSQMQGEELDLGATIEGHYNPLIRRLRAMEIPVVCAVNGVAAGAGANVALACDIVIAAKSASFIQAFSKIGLIPDSGGTWWLPRLVGEARAKALALTGDKLSAEDAAQWGLIWKAVDDEQLMPEALALVENFAKGPTHAYGLTKKAIQSAATNTLDAQLDLERDLQREAGHSDDYKEGVTAFMEKRAPTFTGKKRG